MRKFISLILLTLLAAPALGQQTERVLRDWTAACAPDGYCWTSVAIGRDGTADLGLRIGRHAQQVYWEIDLVSLGSPADAFSDVTVTVDGVTETFSGSSEVGAYGSPQHLFFLGRKAQSILDAMMPASSISIAFRDMAGVARTASFSLSGLTAALIWIDEQQNRLGSERVAAAPPHGLVPATGIEPPPDIPPGLLARQDSDPECRPFEDLANGRDFLAAPLGEGTVLYGIPCWGAAYNFGWKFFVATADGMFAPQSFAEPIAGWRATSTLVNYAWDNTAMELTSYNKARGVGDCGTSGRWRWADYGFVLVEYRMADCTDGPIAENATVGDFPVVFLAEGEEARQQ